jgi:uncharacterized protein YeeX (DUF496 family)
MNRFTYNECTEQLHEDDNGELCLYEDAWDEQDVKDLIAERDKWKTDYELLVDDYKQLSIDLSKKDAEIKILEAEKEALQSTVNWYIENE